ncbi:CU044_2847 family protein [Streptomyces sp. NPDC059396]|uniref:CU044_2847 family protein n=1 Tax=Streptomyces sp. NPDC059396 TaxID=3346819 RepID=UPI0036A849FB
MRSLARISLEGGGSILFEAVPGVSDGPVKAGRVAEVLQDLPSSLQSVMAPVRDTARVVLDQLRQAGPDEVEVEFGVDLAAQAGAVITRAEANCHLKVRALWRKAEGDQGTEAAGL